MQKESKKDQKEENKNGRRATGGQHDSCRPPTGVPTLARQPAIANSTTIGILTVIGTPSSRALFCGLA